MAILQYAQIKDGLVQNIILLADESLLDTFTDGFDYCLRIDSLDPMPQMNWKYDGQNFSPPDAPKIKDVIFNAIRDYQKLAPALLAEIYTENRLNGLTTAQSDKMFDTYGDVVLRIREGAFPTALYRLSQKIPADFVTQELLEGWISKIKSYM